MTAPAAPSSAWPAGADHGLTAWAEALLATARHLGLGDGSPETVRNAAARVDGAAREQAIVSIAHAAGLEAGFVDLPAATVPAILLPALIELDPATVAVIVGIAQEKAMLLVPAGGEVLTRIVEAGALGGTAPRRLLLAHGRVRRPDGRRAAGVPPAPPSWLAGIFSNSGVTLCELGAGALAGNLLAIGTSLFSMQVWDRVVPARSVGTLWVLTAGVALALVLEFLVRTARASLADHFGRRADRRLSGMVFAHVLAIRNDARPRSPATLVAQLRDLEQLRELLTSSTLGVLLELPFMLAYLAIVWILGGPLVLVLLAAIPLVVAPGLLAQIPLARLSREGMSESASRSALLMESIHRIEDIKTLQAEPRFHRLWDEAHRIAGDIGLRQRHLGTLLLNFSQMAQQFAYVGVLVAGAYGIFAGELSVGAVLACSILTSRTIAPLAQVCAVLGRLQNARTGKKAIDEVLALPTDHRGEGDAYHRPALSGRYRFEDVAYAFDPDSEPALAIGQLRTEPGERIAVLGRVGAGKSTLLRLAAGLATPGRGRIVLDGTPMNLIDIADIRRNTGVVLQDSNLFCGTIRENLRIAAPLASDGAILEAMRLACADRLLLDQPHGLDFRIRENGAGLSGGQRQTLVLARTFLRAPGILLLDEPTASLDESTEREIIDNLGNWLGGRTLIVATHRRAVLSLVERIIVLEGGRVVRDGPRDAVLASLGERSAPARRRPGP